MSDRTDRQHRPIPAGDCSWCGEVCSHRDLEMRNRDDRIAELEAAVQSALDDLDRGRHYDAVAGLNRVKRDDA